MQLPPVSGPGMYGVNPLGDPYKDLLIENLETFKNLAESVIEDPSLRAIYALQQIQSEILPTVSNLLNSLNPPLSPVDLQNAQNLVINMNYNAMQASIDAGKDPEQVVSMMKISDQYCDEILKLLGRG